jgi:hypothetical protein
MSKTLPGAVKRVISREISAKIAPETIAEVTTFVTQHVTSEILYGGYNFEDGTLIFLLFLCSNYSYKKLETITQISHSNFRQILGTIRRLLEPWAKQQLQLNQTFEERLRIAQACINDEQFKDCTISLDGTQCRLWTPSYDPDEANENVSFKHNNNPRMFMKQKSSFQKKIFFFHRKRRQRRHPRDT